MGEPKIYLTTNTHCIYLSMLAKVPDINLITFSLRFTGRDWQTIYRPKPSNMIHIPIDEPQLMEFYLNLTAQCSKIILHSFSDIEILCNPKLKIYPQIQRIPKIFVFHNSFATEIGRGVPKEYWGQEINKIKQLFAMNNIRPVFISKWKQESWQMEGDVILPGIDLAEFPSSWTGRNNKICLNNTYPDFSLRVCSNFEFRDFMNCYKMGNQILGQLPNPNFVLGEGNENTKERLPQTIFSVSQSFQQYKEYLNMARFMLTCNNPNFEDYYNLSSLEAMAIGLPVVFTYHDRLPAEMSKSFIVSDNIEYLVGECKKILTDYDYADHLSKLSAGFIERNFSLSNFISRWSEVLNR